MLLVTWRGLSLVGSLPTPPNERYPQRVDAALTSLGWDSCGLLQWSHPSEGILDLMLDQKAKILHQVRVSWRQRLWAAFTTKARRDSALLAEVPFDHDRYKLASKAFAVGNGHVRRVLTGAANSTAVCQVIFRGRGWSCLWLVWVIWGTVLASPIGWACSHLLCFSGAWVGAAWDASSI